MLERGTLRIATYRGAPVLLHWSLALGLLAFGGIRFIPGFWVGFTALILAHELGHAYLVRRMGFTIQSVVVHGFGGFCSWHGQASRLEHSIVAWGGVLAQMFLLLATLLYVNLVSPPLSSFGYQLEHAWITTNLWIIALNLLPIAPLDGAEAWQIFRAMRVESVSFGQIVRRCLPRLPRWSSQTRPRPKPSSKKPPKTEPPKGDGKPSSKAETAIAEALQKIADEAREARRKK